MAEIICSNCQASLDLHELEQGENRECPYCRNDLSLNATTWKSEPADMLSPGQEGSDLLPHDSKIETVEESDSRLVFFIPAGGKQSGGIGCFALIWNLIIGVITGGLIAGEEMEKEIAPFLFLIPFWLVGLGMTCFWIRMKFMRTYVMLEKHRLVIQRVLFGRKSLKETTLKADSRAELQESYSQNDVPVYCVALEGENRTAKFATRLSRPEKDWLRIRINQFLHPDELAVDVGANDSGESLGESLIEKFSAAENVVPVESGSLTPDSKVRILADHSYELRFSLKAIPHSGARYAVSCFVLVFAVIWLTASLGSVIGMIVQGGDADGGQFDWFDVLFGCTFAIPGLIPLGIAAAVARGRVTTTLTEEMLHVRWGWGPIGKSKSMPTDSITDVTISRREMRKTDNPDRNVIQIGSNTALCFVHGYDSVIPLTTFHDAQTTREVAGLVKNQLLKFGKGLPNG